MPALPEIESWEKAFFAGEKEDPFRWKKYPAVKGAIRDIYSDDRTILIANLTKKYQVVND